MGRGDGVGVVEYIVLAHKGLSGAGRQKGPAFPKGAYSRGRFWLALIYRNAIAEIVCLLDLNLQ